MELLQDLIDTNFAMIFKVRYPIVNHQNTLLTFQEQEQYSYGYKEEELLETFMQIMS